MTLKRAASTKWVNIATRKRDDFNDFIKGNDGKNI
ncbi:hypothetical protein [Sporisorium scitamineum]|uniref:Uncharacterized protein n=1 Tax=Sporisorium scitamineum TaxID=49012 RepID=A0A0F7SAN3_9BASI|nr:hypothetical protein [Sporisorium scitamineum]